MIDPHILADTSIWIGHMSGKNERLAELLRRRRILLHPMVIGEIALGSIKDRATVLAELGKLPKTVAAPNAEVLAMIEWLKLYNRGIGLVDAHLLAAARLVADGVVWTSDKRLHAQAERLGVSYTP